MLHFPFILQSVFNFPVFYFYSYFPFVSLLSFIFCLLFHVLPLGAFPHVLFHMVCLFLSPVCFIPWPYIYASCLKTNRSPHVDSFVVVVQSLSQVWLSATPWTVAHQASLSFTVSWSLLKLVHWVNDAIQPSPPLLSPSPPAFSLSQHQDLFHPDTNNVSESRYSKKDIMEMRRKYLGENVTNYAKKDFYNRGNGR